MLSKKIKRVFIGAALPYANSHLHLGHVASLIGGDVLARYHRQKGREVLFISGSDCHGTPITLSAREQNTTPRKIAEKYHKEFKKTLEKQLKFSYDNFSNTLTSTHNKLVQEFFLTLYKKGYIYLKKQKLPYCPHCKMFLPDRYVVGTCPYCGYTKANGDQCDNCGHVLSPEELINPRCKICGTKPIWKETEHFFFKLSSFSKRLEKWIKKQKTWRPNAKNFSLAFIKKGLKDRSITRNLKWGVKIPLQGYKDKRIYVWFDAVIGYLSGSIEWAKKIGKPNKWKDFWKKDCYHYYVHGKDNIPFHTIIWPSMLMGMGGLNLPNQIVSSEYLLLENKQFSKSQKWAIWLTDFLKYFDPDIIRYYLIINNPETTDSNFSWEDFQSKINNELIGTFGNFIYRISSFIYKNQKQLTKSIPRNKKIKFDKSEKEIIEVTKKTFKKVALLIEMAKFKEALKEIINLSAKGNKFLDKKKPWEEIKKNSYEAYVTLLTSLIVINNLRILIFPFLPQTSEKIEKILKQNKKDWEFQSLTYLKIHQKPSPLFEKIDDKFIQERINELTPPKEIPQKE